MSRVKKALLHYLGASEAKFIRLEIDNSQQVVISLKPERFPHLICVHYIKKYSKIPAQSIVNQILSKGIMDDNFVDQQQKDIKAFIKDKSKAILGDFHFKKMKVFISKPKKLLVINKNLTANMITLNLNKSNTKYFAILYQKDRWNMFHPKSTLLLSKNDYKIKKIFEYSYSEVNNVIHIKNLKAKYFKKSTYYTFNKVFFI